MKLKVKTMAVSTGSILIAIINQKDAERLDLHPMDRIKIEKGSSVETVAIDIAKTDILVPQGFIGAYKEVVDSLRLTNDDHVDISLAKKPLSIEIIKKKLDGHMLSQKEFDQVIWDIVHNKLNETELTFFVAGCYTNALTPSEIVCLTRSMFHQGGILKLPDRTVLDKHCIGGVAGNRTTPLIVPIVASAGLAIPKTSSRSITSPAGTADTMEVMANVNIPIDRMKEIVLRHKGCIVWGGSLNLAPADDKIIKVEKPLSIDAESQLIASILAKKLSVSSTHILLDIPVGKGAKIKFRKSAEILKRHFELTAKKLGIHVKVIVTDGSQPIGNGIGPSLEARDILWILKNDPRGPSDLKEKSLAMAGMLLEMGKKARHNKGYKMAKEILESGKAFAKMKEIINAQGLVCDDPAKIQLSKCSFDIKARCSGVVKLIDNEAITKIARVAGAPLAHCAGLYLYSHVGDKVKKGDRLFTVYALCNEKLQYARDICKDLEAFIIR
jgi:putative thymidine phosphorylase